jgi:hypothetical protein
MKSITKKIRVNNGTKEMKVYPTLIKEIRCFINKTVKRGKIVRGWNVTEESTGFRITPKAQPNIKLAIQEAKKIVRKHGMVKVMKCINDAKKNYGIIN